MSYQIKSKSTANYLQRNGFIMVPNLLIDYQNELGITDDEMLFLIKIMKNTANWRLHDSDISSSVSTKTLQRRRKSLKDKGLIDYKTITVTNSLGQKFNDGINYDLSKLENKLQEISNKIEEKKLEEIKKEIKENNLNIEDIDAISESPLLKFKEDWKNVYGTKYDLTKQEREEYNKLSADDKEYMKYIFNYCISNNLLSKITPRLSLFLKTSFRMNDLRNWCNENISEFKDYLTKIKEEDINKPVLSDEELLEKFKEKIGPVEEEKERELSDENGLTENEMMKLFDDLTSTKYMPLAKKLYEKFTGEILTIGESYFDDVYNRIYSVLIENNSFEEKDLNNELILKQIKSELKNASQSRDLWNNGEPVPELNFSTPVIGIIPDEQKIEKTEFESLFDETPMEKLIKRKEEYHQKILNVANINTALKTEEEILREWEEHPEILDEFC